MPGLLVVTADDFGASLSVNEAVEQAHSAGVVTSASLMVRGAAFADAVARARRLPRLSVGLHLVLCDGRPVTTGGQGSLLTDGGGRFVDSPLKAGWRYGIRRRLLAPAIEEEIEAQFEAFAATGLRMDHVDGHHHLHMHPVVFPYVVRAASRFGASVIRIVEEDVAGRLGGLRVSGEASAAVLRSLASGCRRRLALASACTTFDRVYGLRETGRLDELSLIQLARRLREKKVELYAHPDEATEAGRRERDALCSPRVRAAIAEAGYVLVNSRELAQEDS